MGTKVHCKSYLPGYYSMRNLNGDSNGSSCPLFYGGKTIPNGQYYNGFMPRTAVDAYPGYDKNALKQKMLEHEAIFKDQVYELHRVYKIQRDMMEEIKRKELLNHWMSNEASSISSLFASQIPSEDANKWHNPGFQIANYVYLPSILGTEVISSSLSPMKRNSSRAGRFPSQNSYNPKDCEVLEVRLSKVRKKKFDLQLPADEYIDTEGEQFQDNKISELPSCPSSKNNESATEGSEKLFLGGGSGKTSFQGDVSALCAPLKGPVGLADLNEPVQVEEATISMPVDFIGHPRNNGEIGDLDLAAKPKREFLDFSKEVWKSPANNNGTLKCLSIASKGNGSGWFSYMYEGGHKGNLNFGSRCLQQDKLSVVSHPTLIILDKDDQSSGILPTDHTREDMCGESSDVYNYNHVGPVVSSNIPSPHPFPNSSNVTNSWSHTVSWRKPTSSLSQNLASVHTRTSLESCAALGRNPQSSAQIHAFFGENWHANGSCRPTPGSEINVPNRNGFYHGSSSGSREQSSCFPSIGSINQGLEKFSKRSTCVDLNSGKEVNLNEAVSEQDLETIEGKVKCDHQLTILPWLRAKPSCKNELIDSRKDSNSVDFGFPEVSSNQLVCKSKNVKDSNLGFTQKVSSEACAHDSGAKVIGDSVNTKNILGFPIYENPCASKNEPSSAVSTFASIHCLPEGENIKSERKIRVIDINVACDSSLPDSCEKIDLADQVAENVVDKKPTSFTNHIDLNSSLNEDEDPLEPSVANAIANVKIALEIDLEAPAVPEGEEDILLGEEHENSLQEEESRAEQLEVEVARIAAEAIVAISTSGQNDLIENSTFHPSYSSSSDPLLWFVEIVASCADADDLWDKGEKGSRGRDRGDIENSLDEIDYFEVMTLQLPETKEEDYMPIPFIPDIPIMEETGATSLPNRMRRGNARRGRQRRDFQRDVLPGLASLSRHEVTDDLQTFGGIMRATGHPWKLGSTKRNCTRNGAGRGRRRAAADPSPVVASPSSIPLVQQLSKIEVRLEDTSLTGWGKTTRRPRRQRFPAGNPPVPLT